MNDCARSNDENNMVNTEMMRSVLSMQRRLVKKTEEIIQITGKAVPVLN
jgi:hypothetical protein